MFKLIKLTVSSSSSAESGVEVGYLKTHNTRGFQVFNIKHLKGFYRYVRLDFINYYGSEYFCPLSLVRIYGLTQIDAYRRDEKLAAIKLKEEERLSNNGSLSSVLHVPANLSLTEVEQNEVHDEEQLGGYQKEEEEEEKVSDELDMDPVTPLTEKEETINKQELVVLDLEEPTLIHEPNDTLDLSLSDLEQDLEDITTTTSSNPPQELDLELSIDQPNLQPLEDQSNANPIGNATKEEVENLIKIEAQSTATPPPPIQLVNNLPGATNSLGTHESIFGQIMNRLNSLESNHNLLLTYVHHQSNLLQSGSKTLNEKITIMDKFIKEHIHRHETQIMNQISCLKTQILNERNLVNHRIETLDSSINFLKRIGVLQFISILIIIIFLGLSTRIQHISSPTPSSRNLVDQAPGGGSLRRIRKISKSKIIKTRIINSPSASSKKLALGSPVSSSSYKHRSLPHSSPSPSATRPSSYAVMASVGNSVTPHLPSSLLKRSASMKVFPRSSNDTTSSQNYHLPSTHYDGSSVVKSEHIHLLPSSSSVKALLPEALLHPSSSSSSSHPSSSSNSNSIPKIIEDLNDLKLVDQSIPNDDHHLVQKDHQDVHSNHCCPDPHTENQISSPPSYKSTL
ncbi:hypothetical protein KEM48_006125 [Puccinia striiformis f. sp. tritici PST-130]|nr:hypothetical protein KEM48_006125 [Puccinia striiformis f. sp. tritici PST-130]